MADKKGYGQRQREAAAKASREASQAVAEIGPLPKVVNKRRRAKAEKSLLYFLKEYFPHSTGLNPFSDDHKRVFTRLEHCADKGGRFAEVVYRGFAKTTGAENYTLWCLFTGRRRFAALFGAEGDAAAGMLDSITRELETNDLLLEDFPEACYPFRCLEGKTQRARGQLLDGNLTHIEMTADQVVFATVPGAKCSGAILRCKGLTAAGRGMKHKRADGVQVRPDLIIIDDPQTDESAGSPAGVKKRMKIIQKSLMRMGGHTTNPATVILGTIIEPGDLMDQFSDHQLHPEFQSERVPMVKKYADLHESFWLGEYADTRRKYDPDKPGDQERAHEAATELYRSRRKQADAGCVISWEWCYDPNSELSAIQHAYNILIDDGAEVFASECQGAPLRDEDVSVEQLTTKHLLTKIINLPRGIVPDGTKALTSFVDVQGSILYWMICAIRDGYGAHIVDYGTYPDQGRKYFSLGDVRVKLSKMFPGTDEMGAIQAGLQQVDQLILSREYIHEVTGFPVRLARGLVDAGWGKSTATVKTFCRRSPNASVLLCSFGRGILAKHKPISEWKTKNEKKGDELILSRNEQGPHCLFDANYHKWRAHQGLLAPATAPHSITVFRGELEDHAMLFDQICAERVDMVRASSSTGVVRTAPEFEKRQSGADEHLWDCLVGCFVGGSLAGIRPASVLANVAPAAKKKRKPIRRSATQLNW